QKAGNGQDAAKRGKRRGKRHGPGSSSPLATRTIVGRPTGLDDPPHDTALGAATARTGFPLALIDFPAMLKVTQFAAGLDIVAQRGAAGRDRRFENILDRSG